MTCVLCFQSRSDLSLFAIDRLIDVDRLVTSVRYNHVYNTNMIYILFIGTCTNCEDIGAEVWPTGKIKVLLTV